ncbi:hypothetical protein ZIOFF_056997 [Zingiber officinale]|uniref:PHD finger protein ALFIN-LIKE n=1 Tax=Zingiber officinale TaxID=94328 RepID=A0A8J5KLD1_ZINOF|nr:hypothetical protein ZIOFF_056997 [Zingiber officinale]
MDGDGRGAYGSHTAEDVFRDFRARRAGMIKALTTDPRGFCLGHSSVPGVCILGKGKGELSSAFLDRVDVLILDCSHSWSGRGCKAVKEKMLLVLTEWFCRMDFPHVHRGEEGFAEWQIYKKFSTQGDCTCLQWVQVVAGLAVGNPNLHKRGRFVWLQGRRSLGGDYGSGVPCYAGCEDEVAWFAESIGCLLERTIYVMTVGSATVSSQRLGLTARSCAKLRSDMFAASSWPGAGCNLAGIISFDLGPEDGKGKVWKEVPVSCWFVGGGAPVIWAIKDEREREQGQGKKAGRLGVWVEEKAKIVVIHEKENLCLYGLPNETWEVTLPAEEVPPELPEPALGINFARDGMEGKDWLALVAVHSDAWLLAVAFYFGARFGFDKESSLVGERPPRPASTIVGGPMSPLVQTTKIMLCISTSNSAAQGPPSLVIGSIYTRRS